MHPTASPGLSTAPLASEPAGTREKVVAGTVVVVSLALGAMALPYAKVPLAAFAAFIPIYVTALVIFDLVTAVLLLGHYRALKSVGLLVLGGVYLFNATAIAAYALIFPGLFAPTGLLGSGPQTSSALYMLWHAGYPLGLVAYVVARRRGARGPARPSGRRALRAIAATAALVLALVAAFTAFATAGHECLPVFMDDNQTTSVGKAFLISIWLLSFGALVVLLWSRPHSLMDIWLMVALCVWLLDLALAAVLNAGRYDLGWYLGRIYGLVAAGVLLIVLLGENARHYARLRSLTTALQSANETLWRSSMQDGLTELANRRAFDMHLAEHLALAQRHRRPLALVLLDVDHFKAYNDAYGHQLGDECLKAIARVLQAHGKRPSDLAARYGGEEFALVLPETDSVGAMHIAAAAQAAVSGLSIAHRECSTGAVVSISIGIAALGEGEALTPQQMIAMADKALYQAKDAGRNRIVLLDAAGVS